MEFIKTKLSGSFIIKPNKIRDYRGFYSRVWDSDLAKKFGLQTSFIQSNFVYSKKKGTLRGLHYQKFPYGEVKLIRCIKGSIFDVIVDLRKNSPSFLNWYGIKLSEKNSMSLYVPKNFAHGYLTLEDNTEIFYQSSTRYHPKSEAGIHWNDPKIGIVWSITPKIISEKDSRWPCIK